MSSSESDEDEALRIKEAVSFQLLDSVKTNRNNVREKPKSKRKSLAESREENYHKICLKTTPGFQKHVSEKLSTYLDSIIDVVELQQPPAESRKDEYTGVKLLKSSSSILEDSEKKTAITTSKVIKLNSIYSSDSSDENDKLAQVVVTGVDVLMGGKGAFKKEKSECCKTSSKKIKKARKRKEKSLDIETAIKKKRK